MNTHLIHRIILDKIRGRSLKRYRVEDVCWALIYYYGKKEIDT